MQLFRVSLIGVDTNGENHYAQQLFYTDRKLAVECLRQMNSTSIEYSHRDNPGMDWYLWLVEYTEKDGRMNYKDSAVYSYFLANKDGFVARGERKCFETERAIFEIV